VVVSSPLRYRIKQVIVTCSCFAPFFSQGSDFTQWSASRGPTAGRASGRAPGRARRRFPPIRGARVGACRPGRPGRPDGRSSMDSAMHCGLNVEQSTHRLKDSTMQASIVDQSYAIRSGADSGRQPWPRPQSAAVCDRSRRRRGLGQSKSPTRPVRGGRGAGRRARSGADPVRGASRRPVFNWEAFVKPCAWFSI
jgi:hypothetical protein